MGTFIEPEEMKSKSILGAKNVLEMMQAPDIEDVFILPAERLIATACALDLNTEGVPWRWAGRFDDPNNGPRLLAEYQSDYRLAVIQQVNHMATNAERVVQKGVKGAFAIYSTETIHPAVRALMKKWSQPRRLFRT